MKEVSKIALGGGCHWCSEAVFQSLKGVEEVKQGFVASTDKNTSFSEAVIVHFYANEIGLETLIEIHLDTHKSTTNHSMRAKYRSAVYVFSEEQKNVVNQIIAEFQKEFDNQLITEVLPFKSFKASREQIQNYYYNNPEKPFCKNFINPKIKVLLNQFSTYVNPDKLKHLKHAKYQTEYSK